MLGLPNFLWRLIPANPILLRVVETGGRRRRDLFIRCGYLGLLVAVVVFSLMTASGEIGGGSLSALAKTSSSLFQKMSYLQLGLVALLAPVFTAGAITQEKDSQTYDILLATPLSNAQIVLGSLLSRLFFIITLLISGIPIFSITQIFGGVSIRSIVLAFGIAASTAFATGALAMAIATFKVGTRRTIFSFYLFIVIFMAGGILLDRFQTFQIEGPTRFVEKKITGSQPEPQEPQAVDDAGGNTGNPVVPSRNAGGRQTAPGGSSLERAHISWFTGINPFLAMRVVFKDTEYAPPAYEDLPEARRSWPVSYMLTNPTGFYISFMFAFSFVLVMPSILLLRRMAQTSTTFRTAMLRKLRLVRGDQTRKPRTVWTNPIAWREARTKASAARATMLRYGFIAAGLVAALYLVTQYASQEKPERAVSAGSYDSSRKQITLPAMAPGDRPKTLYVIPEVSHTTVPGDDAGTERDFNLLDLHTTMEVLGYTTFADKTSLEDFERRQLGNRNAGSVLMSLSLRPPARGMDAALVRRYLLGLCAVEFAVILLIVTNAAASTVTREKEDGTLDLLLSSPITSRYYIWGKLRGLVSFVLPLVAVPVGSVAIFLIYDFWRSTISGGDDPLFQWLVLPEAVLLMPGMLVIVSAFAAILGMQMSLRCRTTVMAVMSSVGIVVGICATMGWCGYSFLQSTNNPLSLVVGGFSPFTLMQVLIDPYTTGSFLRRAGSDELSSRRIATAIFSLVAVGVYVGVVWQMYTGMVKNFDMTIRKQSR